jgi:hypothetical protein
VPIFLFNAVLIDYARIRLAGQVTEDAVKASARSAMSAYDTGLREYGLFGQGKGNEENIRLAADAIAGNLTTRHDPSEPTIHYAKPDLLANSVELTTMYSLADQIVFKQQILETMKYQAPIELILQGMDKFAKSKTADGLRQAADFAELSEQAESMIESREESLDRAWESVSVLNDELREGSEFFDARLERLRQLSPTAALYSDNEALALIEGLTDQIDRLDQDIAGMGQAIESLEREIVALAMAGVGGVALNERIDQRNQLVQALNASHKQRNELASALKEWQQIYDEIVEYNQLYGEIASRMTGVDRRVTELEQRFTSDLGKAMEWNGKLRDLVGREAAGTASAGDGGIGNGLPANEVFPKWVFGDDEFYQEQTKVSSPIALFHGFARQWRQSSSQDASYPDLIEANRDYAQSMAQAFGSLSGKEQNRENSAAARKRNKQEQKSRLQNVLDQAKSVTEGCPENLGSTYSRLEGERGSGDGGLFSKYRLFNDLPAKSLDKPSVGDANDVGGVSFGLASQLLDLMAKARDEWFVDEYALTYFNYRTYGKDGGEEERNSVGNESVAAHVLPNQEAEYILYGFGSCEANYTAAYAEMFSLRLAIRTTEQLMNPENEILQIGSPALVLLAALARGAADALEDMKKLLDGKDVPFMSKLGNAVRLNYRDYLRLFLLLHSSDRNMLSRTQALIELNTGKNLELYATYMQAKATTSVKLWFLPELFRLFDVLGIQSCRVRNHRCEIARTAVFAY